MKTTQTQSNPSLHYPERESRERERSIHTHSDMASLAFCSSLITTTTTTTASSHNQTPTLRFSQTKHLTFLSLTASLSSHMFSSSTSSPRPPTLSFVPKVSEIEPTVVESEEAQASQVVESTSEEEEPKREEVFAVVMIGGRQYIVFPGQYIYTQRFKDANVNDKVILNKVLLVGTKNSTYLGQPLVPNATVHAVIEEQGLNKKSLSLSTKRRKAIEETLVTDSQIHGYG
ncbi:hypothetical protein LOK49_LG08G01789 [Camellia lanceoleosa]|uniref:Uncharacterized protein n=1 Tax=Camellia lanceoleosa TaxID=1840588 RepID=A0ACC0GRD5_9ERIC|nr:hypothetical protein LOK49_LG08G01789 [Camellia lanceoleosa]